MRATEILTAVRAAAGVCAALLVCAAVQAQTYAQAPTTFNWIDTTGHATVVWTGAPGGPAAECSPSTPAATDDDISQELPLGFTFRFGTTDYTSARVQSNGRLQFNNRYCGYGTQSVGPPRTYPDGYPNSNVVRSMRIYGADLDTTLGGSVSYAALGSAPNRRFVVTWNRVPEWNSRNSYYNLQVVLQENGEFIYQYGNSNNTSNGKAQIGWELTTGDYALVSFTNLGALASTAIRFFRPGTVMTPGGFNTFEPATAAGALTGPIKTKIAGQSFTLDVIALNTARTGYASGALGGIAVELLDASNDSGALNSQTNCRTSWTPIATVTSSFSYAASDGGRKPLQFTLNDARREVRVRVTYSAGGNTVIGCSTDAFAVRPASFASLQATAGSDSTPGVARSLNNTNATSGVVHRAGRPFSVLASAVSATGTVLTGYDGAPSLRVTGCVQPAGCLPGELSSSLSASGGTVAGTVVYSEAGVITADAVDLAFADVDALDSSEAERAIRAAAPVTIGRFVADSYRLEATTAPRLAPGLCGAGPALQSFTYVGQPFAFATAPVVTATPLNAGGQPLANARPRFGASHVSATLAATGAPTVLNGAPAIASVTAGATAQIAFAASSFSFARDPAAPAASFVPTFAFNVTVSDTTEPGATAPIAAAAPLAVSPVDFASGSGRFHYARAVLRPVYGDFRRPLYLPLEVQTFNGSGWIALADAAACLVAPPAVFAYSQASGALASGGAPNCASRVTSTVTTGNGRAAIALPRPGGAEGALSSVTVTLNVVAPASGQTCAGTTLAAASTLAMPWLAAPDGAGSHSANPSARVSWGRIRGDFLSVRERFD